MTDTEGDPEGPNGESDESQSESSQDEDSEEDSGEDQEAGLEDTDLVCGKEQSLKTPGRKNSLTVGIKHKAQEKAKKHGLAGTSRGFRNQTRDLSEEENELEGNSYVSVKYTPITHNRSRRLKDKTRAANSTAIQRAYGELGESAADVTVVITDANLRVRDALRNRWGGNCGSHLTEENY